MASKEVEVLDPTPTVETLKKSASERVLNRRHFIAALGVAGAAVAGTELVRQGPVALAQQPKPNGYAQGDVLNFLLNLNYLKATLYSFMTQGADLPPATFTNLGSGGVFNPPKTVTFTAAGPASAQEVTDLFNELYFDALNQLIAIRNLIGPAAIAPRATMNLAGTGTTTVTATQTVTPVQAIGLLRLLVDVTASAYAGATVYLTGTNLAYVTQALAAIGAHAGALRLIAIQSGAPYVSSQSLTTVSATTQTQNSFTGSLVSGSTTIYNFAPTNPITAGSIISGPGILVNTVVTAVTPPTVYTGTINGTATAPTNIVTNVSPTTGLAVGMTLSGTGIPGSAIITNINGTTVTLGVITGFSSLTPPVPIVNGVTSVSGAGGFGMTLGTYPLVFTGGGGSGAAGTITVVSVGTNLQNPGTYNISLTSSGSGYVTTPTVTAGTGGTQPTLTATVPAQITTAAASVTLTPGFTAATTKGGSTLIDVSQTGGLTPGQLITGTNIPSGVSIAQSGINAGTGVVTMQTSAGAAVAASATSSVAPTGFVTKSSAVITQVSSTSGILFGAPITGTGIPTGATVVAIGSDQSGLNITMSAAGTTTTTGTTTVSPTAQLTAGSTTVLALSSLTGLATGNPVTGVGIPSGTTIASVGGTNTMVLSKAATTSTALSTKGTPTAVLASGNNLVTNVNPMTGLANGQLVVDAQGFLPPGTTITAVTASNNTITLSAPATGSTTLTTVANVTGTVVNGYQIISSIAPSSALTSLAIGMVISGPNIPSGTILTGLPGNVFNGVTVPAGAIAINNFPSAAGGPELIGAALTIQNGTTLTASALQTVTVTAPTLSEAVTIPTLVTVTPSLGTATLSQAPTTTGSATLVVQTADPMDVDPVDPGTAALSAAGPAALAGTSPAVYRGFFATAGGATSTANNPAGAIFARTFSQVLAVLYGSTASQTFEGGFFPLGVGGGINFV